MALADLPCGTPHPRRTRASTCEDRRWIWAPWGNVHWVRNLRAAIHATITQRGRSEEARSTELSADERMGFFRDHLGCLARSVPFGVWFIRTVAGVDLDSPAAAAQGRPVIELHAAEGLAP